MKIDANAVIFDLAAFPVKGAPVTAERAGNQPGSAWPLLNEAMRQGLPCALVTELGHHKASSIGAKLFGEPIHHLFAVVLVDAEFSNRGKESPYEIVLRLMGEDIESAMVVAGSSQAAKTAHTEGLRVMHSYRRPVVQRKPIETAVC